MHAVLTPDCHGILLSQPDSWMGICSEFTQMSQIKYLNTCALQCLLNKKIKLPRFFVYSIVAGIKPQIKLSRYKYLIL